MSPRDLLAKSGITGENLGKDSKDLQHKMKSRGKHTLIEFLSGAKEPRVSQKEKESVTSSSPPVDPDKQAGVTLPGEEGEIVL